MLFLLLILEVEAQQILSCIIDKNNTFILGF